MAHSPWPLCRHLNWFKNENISNVRPPYSVFYFCGYICIVYITLDVSFSIPSIPLTEPSYQNSRVPRTNSSGTITFHCKVVSAFPYSLFDILIDLLLLKFVMFVLRVLSDIDRTHSLLSPGHAEVNSLVNSRRIFDFRFSITPWSSTPRMSRSILNSFYPSVTTQNSSSYCTFTHRTVGSTICQQHTTYSIISCVLKPKRLLYKVGPKVWQRQIVILMIEKRSLVVLRECSVL